MHKISFNIENILSKLVMLPEEEGNGQIWGKKLKILQCCVDKKNYLNAKNVLVAYCWILKKLILNVNVNWSLLATCEVGFSIDFPQAGQFLLINWRGKWFSKSLVSTLTLKFMM